jgi:transitional endoplasmic reticulum ATPase
MSAAFAPREWVLLALHVGEALRITHEGAQLLARAFRSDSLRDGVVQLDGACTSARFESRPMLLSIETLAIERISVSTAIQLVLEPAGSLDARERLALVLRARCELQAKRVVLGSGLCCAFGYISSSEPNGFVCINSSTHIVLAETKREGVLNGARGVSAQSERKLVGVDEASKCLRQLFVPHSASAPRGVLVKGIAGSGKTSIVRQVASECGTELFYIAGATLGAVYVGESEAVLRDAFALARQAAQRSGRRSAVFIDDLDALCGKRDDASQHGVRVVAQLLTLIDGIDGMRGDDAGIVVVAAASTANSLDSALRRAGRLEREVELNPPSEQHRAAILQSLVARWPLADDVQLASVAAACVGYVGADFVALRDGAMRAALERGDEVLCLEDFARAQRSIVARAQHANALRCSAPTLKYSDIGGLHSVKARLREAIEWPLTQREAFARLHIARASGVLLYGPPGCSKTSLVRAAAGAASASFWSIDVAQLYSPYVGEAEATLRELFTRARQSAPAIVFLDEIDAMVGARTERSSGDSVQERVLSTLLNEMDGVGNVGLVLVVAATNRIDAVDAALLRPGRFDVQLRVELPDAESRREIFAVCTRSMPLNADVQVEKLVEQSEGMSGAQIANLCREAALCSLRRDISSTRVLREDFIEAMEHAV